MFNSFYKKMPFLHRSYLYIALIIILIAATTISLFFSIWFSDGDSVSTGTPTILLFLTYLFSSWNSLPYFFLGISYENQIIVHKLLSYISVVAGFLHGGDYLLYKDKEYL